MNKVTDFKSLPTEMLINILAKVDIKTLSNCCKTCKMLNNVIDTNRWEIIDKGEFEVCVPKTKETYIKHRFLLDLNHLIYTKVVIPEDAIVNLEDYINFNLLATYQTLSSDLIHKYYKKISLNNLITHQRIPIELLKLMFQNEYYREHMCSNYWSILWRRQPVDLEFVETYLHNVNWHSLSGNKYIVSFEFLNKYYDKIEWHELTNLGLPEDILEASLMLSKFDAICFSNVSSHSKLSNNFINKYLEYLDLGALVTFQNLDENTIQQIINYSAIKERTDSDDVFTKMELWKKIATYQALSYNFIKQNILYLPLELLIRNKKIKRSFIHRVHSELIS